MIRTLTAAAVLAALSALILPVAQAATAPAAASAPAAKKATKAAKKSTARKAAAPAPVPADEADDSLNPNQLTLADRVLTGVAVCEFKQKVDVEKLEGHNGNFKLSFEKKTYVMVPKETTTGAIVLLDKGGAIEWVQIPKKSMLMNQKEMHRLVDDCQEDEQRIASQSAATAGANAPVLAPSVATPASVAAVAGAAPASGATTTTTTTTTTTVQVVPPAASGAASAKSKSD